MLAGYAARRDRLCPRPRLAGVLHHPHRAAGRGSAAWPKPSPGCWPWPASPPRPGGAGPGSTTCRHTFAVTTLTRWYRDGADVQAQLPVLSAYLGHSCPEATYWYLQAAPELLALAAGRLQHRPAARHGGRTVMTALAPVLEAFFTDRLMTQRGASPHTIASYRDTFRLLLGYLHQQTGKQPAQLDLADLDAPAIGAFLPAGNNPRQQRRHPQHPAGGHPLPVPLRRLRAPEHAALISRVLAIQPKRTATTIVSYLTPAELDALLAAPDRATWHGRRDHALLVFAAQTGLRVSEITGLAISDVHLGTGPHVYCRGKGRKDRATPLTSHTVGKSSPPGSPSARQPRRPAVLHPGGTPLSRDAVDAPGHQARRHRSRDLPDAAGQEDHPAHPAAHRGDEPAARRRRHHRHRTLARPRKPRHHPRLPARRHGAQGEGHRPHHPARHPRPDATRPPDDLLAFLSQL